MTTILVVDDEPVVRDVLARLLEQPGRAVFSASGIEQALACAASTAVDVALVDKNLIGVSGLEVGRRLKEMQPELELILLTAYASFDSAVEAVQIGAFDYLTKPIEDAAALSRKVELAAERSAMRRAQRVLLKQLAESELRFRRLVESTPDALLLCDPETGHILDVNPAAVQLYGRSGEELQRLTFSELRAGPEAEGSWGESPRQEQHQTRDGRTFEAEVRTTHLTVDSRPIRALSVRDVTERERAQRERIDLEERLRLSQKMEAVGRLAGGVAHDFSNLLSVILAHCDFLADQIDPRGEALKEVEGIRLAAQRGAALTRQLLLFSRHKPVNWALIDLNAVVADVKKLLSRVIAESVLITTSLAPGLWTVRADSDQLAQVVLNLAVNARDAMPQGGELRIATDNVPIEQRRTVRGGELLPGRYVRVTMRDTGTGMTPEVMMRLFEPFFTTKEQGKGTGLGLATAEAIVRGAKGAVDLESEPGKGTTFFVYLPAAEGRAPAAAQRPQPHAKGRGETILVVDDEEPLRALVRRILTAQGYTVLEGKNGVDALRSLQAHGGPVHLLITDIVMPEMGGPELAGQLLRERPGVRVLYMTGYTDTPIPEVGPSTGFIQKPFTSNAFLGEVRRLLDG